MPQSRSYLKHDYKIKAFFQSTHCLTLFFIWTAFVTTLLFLKFPTFHRNFFHSIHWSIGLLFELQESGFIVCERCFSRCRSLKKISHWHALTIFYAAPFQLPPDAKGYERPWGVKVFRITFNNSQIFKHRFCKPYLELIAVSILPCLFNIFPRHTFHNKMPLKWIHNIGISDWSNALK